MLMYDKLAALGFTYYDGEIVIVGPVSWSTHNLS
jgi:hypothetical protein